jgi:hypothetical protein
VGGQDDEVVKRRHPWWWRQRFGRSKGGSLGWRLVDGGTGLAEGGVGAVQRGSMSPVACCGGRRQWARLRARVGA